MRILIVEDEKEILDFLKKSLKNECYVVDTASDGEQGSYLARTNDYDLIILDNVMPKKTGLEVCRDVRKDNNFVPILVLSVKSETTTKVDLLNAGADDYLTKPFSIDELFARIKALLRRPKGIENERLQVDDLVLDSSKHIVKRGDEDVYLTRKEFTLLKYLMRHKGTVLSRSMIMEHVWDMTVDPFSNTIESHIVSLRKKVDLTGHKKLIHTVSGRGYKLDTKN
ncbi:DNA-binding response regulator [Candidatus Falkowbacteria bacterium RIFOXYB2_FULL_34_18]|uniref:DNA-binding response regulator n=1 Tax=Candidatus Falkowbacteria bacterium RIFOXYD2_FULL_34_120 TaxID=1798007 RepID=A0A1F5TSJ8_9BACT|nr:MAG: DNA-binding response regulator [Candidatus Falkowbacteria bacterium RIFOXYB2_FULL_34_18]OGF30108.1 MAG: DNA-binding response regulator [Candidatus Falkowbacteria bacterium RIFOXYC12_FULL_34_55]OGF37558.1 MAG: DNA-binding response regulator [Candidatus Falkowbacteria bacterium RIFOXYC2_FULL_34_220]OGF39314.1 MAG: DNA-binding response regulator [Candidatus Falkowbacteria bacterium RIFOXYD12_FULL_34_57]OGF41819.1 MAG: DNA-binding response regulator [Candidatus Falkowbacteria bacterium RIFO